MAQVTEYVLDTSALFTLRHNEVGADTVAEILQRALQQKTKVWVSFITLTEYFYIVYQREGREGAERVVFYLKTLPLQWVDPSEALLLQAGEYKALHSLSLADSLIAATAHQKKAVLVHKDPEYESLQGEIKLLSLPYKKG